MRKLHGRRETTRKCFAVNGGPRARASLSMGTTVSGEGTINNPIGLPTSLNDRDCRRRRGI